MLLAFVSMAYSGGVYWDPAHPLSPNAPFHLPTSVPDFLDHVTAGWVFAAWLFAILAAHEMGHYIACRIYRVHATWPYFLPAPIFMFGTFGAVIRIHARIRDRRTLFDVAIAGPIAGFVVALAALAVGLSTAETVPAEIVSGPGMVYSLPWIGGLLASVLRPGASLMMNGPLAAAWGGFLITVLNLFPAGQLDGGHIAYALSRRLHRWTSWLAIFLAAGAVAWAFVERQPPMYLLWLAILGWMRDRHPPVTFEHSPLGGPRIVLAFVALAMFVLCFTWFPVKIVD
jgi:membrane-associated protease RseP (regulator of RpoE activity)